MKLKNLLALENMGPDFPAPAELETPTVGLTTQPAKRCTARIRTAEQRQLLRAQRIAQNTWHRNNAFDFEREHYRALQVRRATCG